MSDSTPFKRCTKCGVEYPRTNEFFPRYGKKAESLRGSCRQCTSNSHQDWYRKNAKARSAYNQNYYRTNKERLNEANRRWRLANLAKTREKAQDWARTHPEQYRANQRRWRLRNPDKHNELNRKSSHRHPERIRINAERRRTQKRELPNAFTVTDWRRALNYFNNCCAICGRPRGLWHTLAADHWIPLSSSECPGTIPSNILPLCHGTHGCNNSKGKQDPIEWLIAKLGKRKAKLKLKEIEIYFTWLLSIETTEEGSA